MYFSALCRILVRFGLVTPKFTPLTITPFAAIRQKSAYHPRYLRISWTYLDLLYRFGGRIGEDDYSEIRLAVTQGTLLWQPVKFWRCSQASPGKTFTLALAFDNGSNNREAVFKRLNGNNPATSCTNMVSFRPHNFGVYAVKTRNFCRDSVAIWRSTLALTCLNLNLGLDRRLWV